MKAQPHTCQWLPKVIQNERHESTGGVFWNFLLARKIIPEIMQLLVTANDKLLGKFMSELFFILLSNKPTRL